MIGYSWVPVFALICYLFLFLTLVATKKSKETVSFMTLIVIMILWSGGSFAMRIQLWPSPYLWHHVSLLGMFLLMWGYYNFILSFLDEKHRRGSLFWLLFHGSLFIVNCFTGVFVPLPKIVNSADSVQFIYEYTWFIYLLLACILPCMIQMVGVMLRHCKGNSIAYQQLKPIILGLTIMVLGHIAATFPIFMGFPLDIISGPVNVIFIFYSLYKKRLFKITILFSRANYLFAALLSTALFAYNFISPIQTALTTAFKIDIAVSAVIITFVLAACAFIVYKLISLIFNFIFIRTEINQQNRLTRFGEEINHVLNINDILRNFTETIQEITHIDRMFVFIPQTSGEFRVEYTTNLLDEKNFYLSMNHPLITHFKNTEKYISLRDFNRTTVSRSLWEAEKQVLKVLNTDIMFPIINGNTLSGMLFLPSKKDNVPYRQNDINWIQSVCNTCALPLHEACSYERAMFDARKDKLTGLINRKFFFELLDSEFEKYKETSLSLCILSLDNFKMYNQLFGVAEGDAALQNVAGLLISSLNETSTAARIGGKEFAVILPGYDIHSAKLLTENLAAEIGKINSRHNTKISSQLTVSAGICAAPYMASSAKELFQNVETAVYTVKRSGKNAVQIYSSEIYHQQIPQYKHSSGYNENASTIYALTAAIDAKDHYTFQHCQNVAYYATELAKAAGMESDLIEILKEAALLHDIGKIGIREDILNKPGKLTLDEFEIMKGHVENAVNIIRHLPSLDYVIPTVSAHHERYDGKGYPKKLAGNDIPIMGRVLCLADSFDAMTSARSYKPAYSKEQAMQILYDEAGKHFDPEFAIIFIELLKNNKIEIRGQKDWLPTGNAFPSHTNIIPDLTDK